jgi:hypothetical protein
MYTVRYFYLILAKLEFPRQSIKKIPNIEPHKIPLAVKE